MRRALLIALTLAAALATTASGAQAVVVDMNAVGQSSVGYDPSDQSGYYGVAMVPGTIGWLASVHIPAVVAGAPCNDPALSPDFGPSLPLDGICAHGGDVLSRNETFALTWDPLRRDWATTRQYVEQFLRDVADGSGTFTSPYAVTPQYVGASGRAGNNSLYGGGCIDFGLGGDTCRFGDGTGSGTGLQYPANGCPVTGVNQFVELPDGSWGQGPNDVCLTDAQIQGEIGTMIVHMGILGHVSTGYTPLFVMLTPPGVEVCLDKHGALCSANSLSTTRFCSYHSKVNVGGSDYAYIVQPWTPSWPAAPNGCDDPSAPDWPSNPTAESLAVAAGQRLLSPISQAQIASIVNPWLSGWYSLDGAEINDNGCVPFGNKLDNVTVGTSGQNPYALQREFNNGGVLTSDTWALSCTPAVSLTPAFVVPSAVNPGDMVAFDGSVTRSTLLVPKLGYVWDFGDGTSAQGPSVAHSFAKGGTYAVKLTVTDRGGNVASVTENVDVSGAPSGPGNPPPPTQPTNPPPPTGTHPAPSLHVRIQLMPQSLGAVLRFGVSLRLNSSAALDGLATLLISHGAAQRAHLRPGRGSQIVVGRGTVSGVKAGSSKLRLRLPSRTAKKLMHLRHLTLTVRLDLASARGNGVTVDAAGRY